MYPIGSYVVRGAGSHDNGEHVYMGLRAILTSTTESSRLGNCKKSFFMYTGMLRLNTQYVRLCL
eukprot:6090740-Pleurochrysis_carterae.AAC.1